VPLFDRDRARKPPLTKAGAAVLTEARNAQVGVDNLRAKVKGLLDGLEPALALVST
jgi:DNA-binding transcriptional LysR family regulator